MHTETVETDVGQVVIVTTDNEGLPVEHWADRFLVRLIHVADDADPVIKDSVTEFKEAIKEVAVHYMKQAIISEYTTIHSVLTEAGHTEAAELLRRRA